MRSHMDYGSGEQARESPGLKLCQSVLGEGQEQSYSYLFVVLPHVPGALMMQFFRSDQDTFGSRTSLSSEI